MDDNHAAMSGSRVTFQSNAPAGVIGKLFFSLFFLVFFAAGAFFFYQIARDVAAGMRARTWQQANCEIITSQVGEPDTSSQRSSGFTFLVQYRYTFAGQTFTSDQYRRKPATFSDYAKAARLVERYHPGSSATCYVNPSAPAEAILERDSLFMPLQLLFPLVFVAIGGGGIYFAWRRKSAVPGETGPISDRASPTAGRRPVVLFSFVFLLMGCGFLYGLFLRPVSKILVASRWPAVPCVVISSEVRSHDSDDGTTYSVNILYRYEFNGREFKSNRYHFMGGSSSGYSGKQAVVSRHPPGSSSTCYVNPGDPTEAVLERGFTPDLWFGLIPLAFVAVGAGLLIATLRKPRADALTAPAAAAGRILSGPTSAASMPMHTAPTADSVTLKPKSSPLMKLFVITGVALFWNGIVSVFVGQVVKGWRSGHPEWFLTIFMIPFVVIGLVLIFGIVYGFLALFNPRPRLVISPGAVPLGGTLHVQWQLTGRTSALQNLSLRLEGREEATYRRGTTTTTDRSVFANIDIANVTTRPEMWSGSGTVNIPAGLMHSFASKNNKIVWSIQLQGKIAMWPDVSEEFPLTVLPAARKS